MNRDNIFVMVRDNQFIIFYEGKKLIKPIDIFKDFTTEQIKDWFMKEVSA